LAASVAGIRNQFVQDDLILIAQNVRIHELANWREILSSPFWPPPYSEDLYRPLTALLLAVEWALSGGSPLLFRIVSYLLYAGAALGVFRLGRKLLPLPLVLGVALLFASHPVHVEAVALGVGQNELLVGLLATLAVTRYFARRRKGQGSGWLSSRDWMLLGGLYLAACLLKEAGLVLPALLLAAELTLLEGNTRDRLRRLAPGYALLAGIGALVLLARAAVFPGHFSGTFTADALSGLSAGDRALTMLRVVPEWARLLLWPAHLQADYSPQELVASTGFGTGEAAGLVLLLAGAATAWFLRRRAPVFSFGIVWAAIALLPVSNVLIPTGILLAERTLLLPSIGLLLALGGLLAPLVQKDFFRLPDRRPVAIGAWSLVAILALAGVLRSAERQRVWRDETTLRIRSAEDAPRSWRTQLSYGTALFELGQRAPALEAYQRAVALAPARLAWRVRNDLAQRYFATEENERAVKELRGSLELAPDIEETRHYLVLGYLTLGEYTKAGQEADSALARGFYPSSSASCARWPTPPRSGGCRRGRSRSGFGASALGLNRLEERNLDRAAFVVEAILRGGLVGVQVADLCYVLGTDSPQDIGISRLDAVEVDDRGWRRVSTLGHGTLTTPD
jgi:tetratricopeptide (TPR) repeat protein